MLDQVDRRGAMIDHMKRTVALTLMTLLITASGFLVLRDDGCRAWQDDYKRFLYSEALKNSPIVYNPEDIDRIIGERPDRCMPPTSLTDEDVARFLNENRSQ